MESMGSMASIFSYQNRQGKTQYRVHFLRDGTMRKRVFKTIEEACELLYQAENDGFSLISAENNNEKKIWSLQKLIYFFVGHKHHQMRHNEIKLSTYMKVRYELLAIRGDIVTKPVTKVCARDFTSGFSPAAILYLRAAFKLLISMNRIEFNPVPKPPKTVKKPVIIPSKKTIENLLRDSEPRERIACYLGAVCGLRIGEALALTYRDVDERSITINKQMTKSGVRTGLKRGLQRRITMPAKLYALLEPDKLDTDAPLIASETTGQAMSLGYSTSGKLSQVLEKYEVTVYHHLRHFAVSRLAERGVDIIKVSRLIGHRKVSTTVDIYGHLFGDIVDLDFE
ncbi:site-specific integrase [Yersinia pestis subsp. pestis]|uniref:site-specific integrase n=5 Tax=Yersinia pestis TaxID=632 RepID=UPI000B00E48A|nr:site-specific integrase [Yersinia pestis]MCF2964474.1 site-specific integrase [Yersinia pestis subsp. pestis]